jgi:DNA-binding XRE family transcriptional regulator
MILHVLPGEGPGDTAELIMNPAALDELQRILTIARIQGHCMGRFRQRDGVEYSLMIDMVDKPFSHPEWRHRPLAYTIHQAHVSENDRRQNGVYDLDKLKSALFEARKKKGHGQKEAAAAMGISLGVISHIENCQTVPKPETWAKLLAYLGRPITGFLMPEPRDDNGHY